jgi:hypothetical protein
MVVTCIYLCSDGFAGSVVEDVHGEARSSKTPISMGLSHVFSSKI